MMDRHELLTLEIEAINDPCRLDKGEGVVSYFDQASGISRMFMSALARVRL